MFYGLLLTHWATISLGADIACTIASSTRSLCLAHEFPVELLPDEWGLSLTFARAFSENQPESYPITSDNFSGLEFLHDLEGKSKANIHLLIGICQVPETTPETKQTLPNVINKILADNLQTSQNKVADLPLGTFNCHKAVKEKVISYVACCDSKIKSKFACNLSLNLVFINNDVAIFVVKRSFNQVGALSR